MSNSRLTTEPSTSAPAPKATYTLTMINGRRGFFGTMFSVAVTILRPIGWVTLPILRPIGQFVIGYLPRALTGDYHDLSTKKTDFILGEVYNRAAESKDGIGVATVGPYRIPRLSWMSRDVVVVVSGGYNVISWVTSYGDVKSNLDPAARNPFKLFDKAMEAKTIATMQGPRALAERGKLKSILNGNVLYILYQDSLRYMRTITPQWDGEKSLQQNVSHFCINMIAKHFIGIPDVPMEYIPIIQEIGDLLAQGDNTSSKYHACQRKLVAINKALLTKDPKTIVSSKKYIFTQLDEQTVATLARTDSNPRINAEAINALIKTGGGAGLLVEGNISGLIAAALIWLNEDQPDRRAIRHKLREEILASGWKEETERNVEESYKLLRSLKYLNAVLQEALRYLSPTTVIPRATSVDNLLTVADEKGVHTRTIPAGTHLFFAVRRIHHDPRYWRNPEEFNPSRFEEAAPHPHFFPFSNNMRQCPAQTGFAEILFKVAIASIVVNFDLTLQHQPKPIPVHAVHPRVEVMAVRFVPAAEAKTAAPDIRRAVTF